MHRWRIGLVTLCCLHVTAARIVAQDTASAAAEAGLPDSIAHALWEALLRDYAEGKRKTEVDFMWLTSARTQLSSGSYRKGEPPRMLRPREGGITDSDSAWVQRMIAGSLVDGACAQEPLELCPGSYVTLFLDFEWPELLAPDRAEVIVNETGLDPERCRQGKAMRGFWTRRFLLQRGATGWRVTKDEGIISGSGGCRRSKEPS
jgi:hypothetical protein